MRFTIPYEELVANAFFRQEPAQFAAALPKGIVLAYRNCDLKSPQVSEYRLLVEFRQKMIRRVEINVLVVISAEEIWKNAGRTREIIAATECHNLRKEFRMAQSNVDRMIRADAAAMRDQFTGTIFSGRQRRDFLQNVGLVLAMSDDSFSRGTMRAVQAFGIDAIDTEQLD
jgi:hypothetical protein